MLYFIVMISILVEILELHMNDCSIIYILIWAAVASSMHKSCRVLAKNCIENYLVR